MGAKIGELRHRITFQSVTLTPDGQGGFTESWANTATVWAEVTPKTAKQVLFAGQNQQNKTHEIVIRNTVFGISTDMRIDFQGRIFHIHGIRREHERRFFTILDCEEGKAS